MTFDAPTASILVAAIAAIGTCINTLIAVHQGRKVTETHKQVTVNHHSSDFPTVLDRIDDVQTTALHAVTLINGLHGEFNEHVTHSNEMDARLLQVEREVQDKA